MPAYSPTNTTQLSATSAAGAAATLKLPNGASVQAPDAVGTIFPIGPANRWRIYSIIASYSGAPVTVPTLIIADGVFTWTIDVQGGSLPLIGVDVQCAGGAEVNITLAGSGALIAHLNVTVGME